MIGKLVMGRYLIWMILLLGQLHGSKSWIQKEREALLELKKYLISVSQEGTSDYVLTTWTSDTKSDCSQWEGVQCDVTSARVIGISIGLTIFKEGGSLLNLSLLHPFEELRYMNLSGERRQFNGFFDDVEGYKSLRRFTKLESLDLSLNYFNNSIFHFLNAATSLTTLILQDNYMKGPFPIEEVRNLKKLELLDLSGNKFNGSVPELSYLKQLKALDLSSNDFSSSLELQELNLTNLEVLSLALNSFTIPIPIQVICEMKNLRELDLRGNNFVGQVPICLGNLKKLRVLDLSSNQFTGNIPPSFSSLESLEYLSLLDNNLTGLFSLDLLANLTNLKVLKLSSTSDDMVQVKTDQSDTWEPRFQLSVAVLRSCSLEKVPSFLVNQRNLRLLDLSGNRLSGNIPTWLLASNPQLEVLQLQNNSFTFFQMPTLAHNLQVLDFSTNGIRLFLDNIGLVLPSLIHMNGSDNLFQGHFPSSIGELKNITFLDLSYNNFSGELPRNFITGCVSLKYLKLSRNKFTGHFFPRGTTFTSMDVLRMDNNLFTGKIGLGLLSSTNLSLVDMSNNFLTGAIPSWISKLSYLEFLMLSNNFLQGTMPSSLLLMPSLSFLDLSKNLISGPLPSRVNSVVPKNLFLHNNNLTGLVPDTLLENVQILDLRNNKLSGSIAKFVYTQDINVLLLRGNNLTGSIPRQVCDLSNIRLLDLSNNKLYGSIPSCLSNLSFGREEEGKIMSNYVVKAYLKWIFKAEFYKSTFLKEEFQRIYLAYQEIDIKFSTKQRYDSYTKGSEFSNGILDYMYGMDLSNNGLSGLIPAELGDLSKLRALNLSRNFLSSSIPSSFSNLRDLESLDLSYNMLHGSIPHQLASLTSLAVFDVSHNNLSGRIPQERQFNTFNEKIYLGNRLLCGPPTNRSCDEAKKSSEETHKGEEDDEDVIDIIVFCYSIASGYVTVLIGIILIMCVDCRWRRAWLRFVDAFIAWTKHLLP